jgi:23S rRNA (uracil1939-C5)-methyltransferase
MGKDDKMSVILKVEGYNSGGAGVCRHEGKTVFVPFAVPGETVEVNITREHKSYCEGRILNIVESSDERRHPLCDIFYTCGGCSLMHMSYGEQLRFKKQKVENALKRIGGIDCRINDIIGMDEPYGYRNKALYSKDGSRIGFYRKNTHEVVETQRCMILPKDVEDIKNKLRNIIDGNDAITGILIRRSFANDEISVILITGIDELTDPVKVDDILKTSDKISSIDILDPERNITRCLYGKGYIEEKIGGYVFRIYPDSFFQVNTEQTKKLYDVILKYADPKGHENVIDLYCGAGTIAAYIAGSVKEVIGVDTGKRSIQAAMENIEINNITNVRFIKGKAEDVLKKIDIHADIVIVDPPRAGCDAKVLKDISDMKPDKVIYVSCDPSTLARDLKILVSYGYDCLEAQPVDMFPQTEHVETVVLMLRVKE